MVLWLKDFEASDVLISSRIRLARNLKNYKYPNLLSIKESDNLTDEILNGVKNNFTNNYRFYRLKDLDLSDQLKFMEKHLISPKLIDNNKKSSFLLEENYSSTIMINEEDHIRIQALSTNLNLKELWEKISKIDDKLEKNLEYAFDIDKGYLTSCPTNVGTGLRVSVMLHLPCLSYTKKIKPLIKSLEKIGLITRGIYGEGTEAVGSIYQISNQRTLGYNEDDILNKIIKITNEIINKERTERKRLCQVNRLDIEDMISRSYGLLKYSKKMSIKESIYHISNIRLALSMGLMEKFKYSDITKLMIKIQPATIETDYKIYDKEEKLRIRSKINRKFILGLEEL